MTGPQFVPSVTYGIALEQDRGERIIQAPMRLVDYVVVHEFVHLRYRGHDRDYWRALGRVMPDCERRREDLRQRGPGLAW